MSFFVEYRRVQLLLEYLSFIEAHRNSIGFRLVPFPKVLSVGIDYVSSCFD